MGGRARKLSFVNRGKAGTEMHILLGADGLPLRVPVRAADTRHGLALNKRREYPLCPKCLYIASQRRLLRRPAGG